MPAKAPKISKKAALLLKELGEKIHAARKKQNISAAATAEAAGLSRISLHRVEKGEASVAMGSYFAVIQALGLQLELLDVNNTKPSTEALLKSKIPKKIIVSNYPELKRLAWQIRKDEVLSPQDALEIYERNFRYLEPSKLSKKEANLINRLSQAFGKGTLNV